MTDWRPAVADVTPHLRRWTEGGTTTEQDTALAAFIESATGSVVAEVGHVIGPAYWQQAKNAAVWLAAYRFLRSWHPEEDPQLLERFNEDHRDEVERLKVAIGGTSQEAGRRKFGSPRIGTDFINTYDAV